MADTNRSLLSVCMSLPKPDDAVEKLVWGSWMVQQRDPNCLSDHRRSCIGLLIASFFLLVCRDPAPMTLSTASDGLGGESWRQRFDLAQLESTFAVRIHTGETLSDSGIPGEKRTWICEKADTR